MKTKKFDFEQPKIPNIDQVAQTLPGLTDIKINAPLSIRNYPGSGVRGVLDIPSINTYTVNVGFNPKVIHLVVNSGFVATTWDCRYYGGFSLSERIGTYTYNNGTSYFFLIASATGYYLELQYAGSYIRANPLTVTNTGFSLNFFQVDSATKVFYECYQ